MADHPPQHVPYRHKPGVIETDLDDELVLLNPATQGMFNLNRSGRFIWRSLPESTLEDIARRMSEVFTVSPEEALRDAQALVAALEQEDLIEATE